MNWSVALSALGGSLLVALILIRPAIRLAEKHLLLDPPGRHKRHHRPIFLIDLAIPRDIDPAIDKIDGVFLYNLDDLHEIVKANLEKRKKEIPKASKIIDEFVISLCLLN